jgi:hypothetical protein
MTGSGDATHASPLPLTAEGGMAEVTIPTLWEMPTELSALADDHRDGEQRHFDL